MCTGNTRGRRRRPYKEDAVIDLSMRTYWCIVRSEDFNAMKHVMATLWKPRKSVYVKELEENL
ncbi:hypothetical protein Ccrd_009837 [Cynara cardunculus var. scolymus]|uniref:Uncharacterized protein n=1 Tax=Cynara cardunculus var. scolymus TaxID=59895 RepID=A0A103YMG7_CYNCS|nr:hypothetical protein Ccrd_009837 [Cynara cardunculus var. scolymus]